jgi:hypothetical protein
VITSDLYDIIIHTLFILILPPFTYLELEVFALKRPIKKVGIFFILQLLIFITSLLYYNKVNLKHYIDISFYFTSVLLLSGLLIYIISSGFFDVVTKGFSKAFSRDNENTKIAEITPLSKLISISLKPLILYGLLLGLCMAIALLVYYL